ncbi:MAG: acyltransferase [Lachnospiraceae bacterium]|nr:acyltransferase [Lachnospiraceae bacterium]
MVQEKAFPEEFYTSRFDGIQTLRGISAVLIVMHHMRFFARGAFGVDIFFCISGFMIMLTTHRGPDASSGNRTRFFLRKRLIRIVPFYYLMTFLTYALLTAFPDLFEQTQTSVVFLIKSLLFIPFDIGNGVLQPLLRVGWTINCEIFFYLLFFLALHISHRYRGLICSALLFLCVLIGAAASGGRTITGESLLGIQPFWSVNAAQSAELVSPWLAPVFFYGCPVMLEFALGILCYYIAGAVYQKVIFRENIEEMNLAVWQSSDSTGKDLQKSQRRQSGTCYGILSLLAGLVLLLLLILTAPRVNLSGWRRPIVWGLPAMLTVLAFFTAGLFLKMPRFLVRLGDISFSIYLLHYYPVMFLDREVFDFSKLNAISAAGALVIIVLVIAAALITWNLIENRLSAFLRGRFCVSRTDEVT